MRDKPFRERVLIEHLSEPKPRVLIDEDLPLPYPQAGRTNGRYGKVYGNGRGNGSVSRQEERFLQDWVTRYDDPARSARAAGYPPVRARRIAYHLLSSEYIKRRLAEIEQEMISDIKIDKTELFREVLVRNLRIMRAEPPVSIINPPCRYCWGNNHEYQREYGEFEEAFAAHLKSKKGGAPFDQRGGSGYNEDLPPNTECPNCFGRGDTKHPKLRFKDSRLYTPEQRELFNGGKYTKEGGIELFYKDQAQARNFVNEVALRIAEYTKPEVPVDLNDMSVSDLKKLIDFAKEQGFDPDDTPNDD